jgi:hypothetical protein
MSKSLTGVMVGSCQPFWTSSQTDPLKKQGLSELEFVCVVGVPLHQQKTYKHKHGLWFFSCHSVIG